MGRISQIIPCFLKNMSLLLMKLAKMSLNEKFWDVVSTYNIYHWKIFHILIVLSVLLLCAEPERHQLNVSSVDYGCYNIAGSSQYLYVVSIHAQSNSRKEAQKIIELVNENADFKIVRIYRRLYNEK